MTDERRRNARK